MTCAPQQQQARLAFKWPHLVDDALSKITVFLTGEADHLWLGSRFHEQLSKDGHMHAFFVLLGLRYESSPPFTCTG
jgi:hypothetical protein